MQVVEKCLHFVMPYMRQNKKRKQTLESAQYGLEIIFNNIEHAAGAVFQLVFLQLVLPFRERKNFQRIFTKKNILFKISASVLFLKHS